MTANLQLELAQLWIDTAMALINKWGTRTPNFFYHRSIQTNAGSINTSADSISFAPSFHNWACDWLSFKGSIILNEDGSLGFRVDSCEADPNKLEAIVTALTLYFNSVELKGKMEGSMKRAKAIKAAIELQ